MSGNRRSVQLPNDDNGANDDDEPLYENFKGRGGVMRACSEPTPSASVGKKPKPGPKPTAVMKAVAKLNMQHGQQSHQMQQSTKSSDSAVTDAASKPPNLPSHSYQHRKGFTAVNSALRPAVSGLPVTSVTVKPKDTAVALSSKKSPGSETKDAAGVHDVDDVKKQDNTDNATYIEAADVRISRLPSIVMKQTVTGVSDGANRRDNNHIYEEAMPVVCAENYIYEEAAAVQQMQQFSPSNDRKQLAFNSQPEQLYAEACPVDKAFRGEECLYEDASAVRASRLPSNRDSVFTEPEPLYAEAVDVSISRMPLKSQRSSTSAYGTVADARKSSTDVDSDNEEDPTYIKQLFLSRFVSMPRFM